MCYSVMCNMTAARNYNGKCVNENEPSNDRGQITLAECNLFRHVRQ